MNRSRRTAGTSLVEILVVIVVFLIGILAIVQIFPGGFRLLGLTRNQSVATQLGRSTIEYLKSRSEQLPDMVVPASFSRVGGNVVVFMDSTRLTNDLGPAADGLQADRSMTSGGNNIGPWRYVSGGNTVTRIVGEGRVIPAPRPLNNGVGVNSADYYGGVMTLLFGPAVFNSTVASDRALFAVYGNDLDPVAGPPPAVPTDVVVREYQYFCDQPTASGATLYIPQVAAVSYHLSFTAYATSAGGSRTIDVLDAIVDTDGLTPYYTVPLSAVVASKLLPGEIFTGIEFDSLQLGRLFNRIAKNVNFSGDPYEYKLIDDLNMGTTNANLGVLLFNPAGYKYFVPSKGGRRVPLTARVNYNVFDWGLLHDELRIPTNPGESAQLTVKGLKVKGNPDTDGLPYQGVGFVVPDGASGTQQLDVVVEDTETGGIYAYDPANLGDATRTAYTVDKSLGLVRFLDRNPATPELEVTLYDPVTWSRIQIDDARGRSIRVFYQSTQEYQVQVLKASSRYVGVSAIPGVGEVAIGNPAVADQASKIFFSWSELGRKVNIGEAYYYDGANVVGPVTFSGVITAPKPGDSVQQPSIDIRSVFDPAAVRLDGSKYGYAVRYVRGASVAVRVLWNPAKFTIGPDSNTNMKAFDKWGQNWRRSITETYLQKGGQQ